MDAKQIVTLAVIFVAGLVLGNIAGNVTGYSTKTTATVDVSPSTLTLTGSETAAVPVTVSVSVSAGQINQHVEIDRIVGDSYLRVGKSETLCDSSVCNVGQYSAQAPIPLTRGTYLLQVRDRKNNIVATTNLGVQ